MTGQYLSLLGATVLIASDRGLPAGWPRCGVVVSEGGDLAQVEADHPAWPDGWRPPGTRVCDIPRRYPYPVRVPS